jgi:hypothetical protein
MRFTSPLFPARCTLHVGDRILPALPVLLSGQEAAVVVESRPLGARAVRLLVDWDAGGTTELTGRLRAQGQDRALTRLDVYAVGGDWQPFLAWLGQKATA